MLQLFETLQFVDVLLRVSHWYGFLLSGGCVFFALSIYSLLNLQCVFASTKQELLSHNIFIIKRLR